MKSFVIPFTLWSLSVAMSCVMAHKSGTARQSEAMQRIASLPLHTMFERYSLRYIINQFYLIGEVAFFFLDVVCCVVNCLGLAILIHLVSATGWYGELDFNVRTAFFAWHWHGLGTVGISYFCAIETLILFAIPYTCDYLIQRFSGQYCFEAAKGRRTARMLAKRLIK